MTSVYIENRDGNANVKIDQDATLRNAYSMLKANSININYSRMDAGSYSKDIVAVVAEYSELFYIRANRCISVEQRVREITQWQEVEINYKKHQVASLDFTVCP